MGVPPWRPYSAPYVPPPAPYLARAQDKRRLRQAGWMLGVAALLHFLCIPLALVAVKAIAEMTAGRSVSWDEFFVALQETGLVGLLMVGIVVQLVFAFVAILSAASVSRGRRSMAVPSLVVGIIAAVFSIVVFGGILGLIGGMLSGAGGFTAMPQRTAYMPYPPPYVAPPAQWPPVGPRPPSGPPPGPP